MPFLNFVLHKINGMGQSVRSMKTHAQIKHITNKGNAYLISLAKTDLYGILFIFNVFVLLEQLTVIINVFNVLTIKSGLHKVGVHVHKDLSI